MLRDGAVFADGAKRDILTEAKLAALYQTRLKLVEADGYFLARPATGT